jgi:hypothetical protein
MATREIEGTAHAGERHLVEIQTDHAGNICVQVDGMGLPKVRGLQLTRFYFHARSVDEQHALTEPGGADIGKVVNHRLDRRIRLRRKKLSDNPLVGVQRLGKRMVQSHQLIRCQTVRSRTGSKSRR